jgi:hypothetical protein
MINNLTKGIKMNKTIALITILVMILFGVAFSQQIKTIRGEVIDISCYAAAGAKGDAHKECALACIKAGEPAGILEEGTGKVYIVVSEDHSTNPSVKVVPFVGKMVEITGTVNEKGGVSTVDIKDIREVTGMSMGMPKENKMMEGD